MTTVWLHYSFWHLHPLPQVVETRVAAHSIKIWHPEIWQVGIPDFECALEPFQALICFARECIQNSHLGRQYKRIAGLGRKSICGPVHRLAVIFLRPVLSKKVRDPAVIRGNGVPLQHFERLPMVPIVMMRRNQLRERRVITGSQGCQLEIYSLVAAYQRKGK